MATTVTSVSASDVQPSSVDGFTESTSFGFAESIFGLSGCHDYQTEWKNQFHNLASSCGEYANKLYDDWENAILGPDEFSCTCDPFFHDDAVEEYDNNSGKRRFLPFLGSVGRRNTGNGSDVGFGVNRPSRETRRFKRGALLSLSRFSKRRSDQQEDEQKENNYDVELEAKRLGACDPTKVSLMLDMLLRSIQNMAAATSCLCTDLYFDASDSMKRLEYAIDSGPILGEAAKRADQETDTGESIVAGTNDEPRKDAASFSENGASVCSRGQSRSGVAPTNQSTVQHSAATGQSRPVIITCTDSLPKN